MNNKTKKNMQACKRKPFEKEKMGGNPAPICLYFTVLSIVLHFCTI